MNQYKLGQSVRFSMAATALGAGPASPPSVACTVHSPSGQTYAPAVVNDSLGYYHADFAIPTTETAGIWTVRYQATGALSEYYFQVLPLNF